MSPQRRRRLTPTSSSKSSKDVLIWILLVIVLFESYLLFKIYQRKTVTVNKSLAPHSASVIPEPSRKIYRATAKSPPRVVSAPSTAAEKPAENPLPQSPPLVSRGKIAIIIDDSGYNIEDCHHLASISAPVTISILPNLEYSTAISECAPRYHKEVMLHLPLEAHVSKELYPPGYMITTKMPKDAVLKRLREALASVPSADGINNHAGSKATEDERLMAIIFAELKQRHMFFVDSLVTGKSICRPVAAKINLPFTKRDVFLDNENRREYIEKQFKILAQYAKMRGFAVGIGHTRSLTWQIIQEQTEILRKQGFELVTVGDIIKATAKVRENQR